MILRPYQKESVDLTFRYLTTKKGNPLIGLPTGSGKSLVIANIIKQVRQRWPETNILVLSHVREILTQNDDHISQHIGEKVAVYSAGLGRKEVERVTIAGIQSAVRNIDVFKRFNFVIIDEAHLIPFKQKTMYRKFLNQIGKHRCLGLTATPYRLGGGYIYGSEDSVFDELIIDMTSGDRFVKLITDGYLCNVRTKATELEFSTEGIHRVGGDFNEHELAEKFNRDEITDKAIDEILRECEDRKKWLLFAIDIDHAESIAEKLLQRGVMANVVHSKMEQSRDKVISDFKSGQYRAIVNVNVLTTGFDAPDIDLICLLRPTESPVLHVQTIGRGLRTAEGKKDCLVLDFAGNTARLGPINDITLVIKGSGRKGGDPITKKCPECRSILPPAMRVCHWCGHIFDFKTKLKGRSGNEDIVRVKEPDLFIVSEVSASRYAKKNSPDMILVKYVCGLRTFRKWVCLDHQGYAGEIAHKWLKNHILFNDDSDKHDPVNVDDFFYSEHTIRKPESIVVDYNGKYPEIVDYN